MGLHVTSLGSGSALVSRHDRDRVTALSRTSWLVDRSGSGGDEEELRQAASTAGRLRGTGRRTVLLAPGAQLLIDDRRARENTHALQKAAADFLGNEHVCALLEHYGVNCVLDVGANTGQFAKRLRSSGYRGRIVSFEPVPDIAEKLSAKAKDDPEWWVYPHALGAQDDEADMTVVKGSMSSLLGPSEYGTGRYKRFRSQRTEQVPVRRLEGLLDELLEGIDDPRPYLKLDTQGYDLQAFHGAGDRIKDFVGMQSEVALLQIYSEMPRLPESLAAYEAAGFEVTGMFPVTREKDTGRALEFDCVMMRAGALPDSKA
jgi:FkbM family methyltransferase